MTHGQKLFAELRRLYFFDDQRCVRGTGGESALSADVVAHSLAGGLASNSIWSAPTAGLRAIVEFNDAADWPHAADLYRAVQDGLDLPAPALGVAGRYQLWFSLARAVPVAQASAFLAALRARYLADLPAKRAGLHPAAETLARVALTPEQRGEWAMVGVYRPDAGQHVHRRSVARNGAEPG